MKPITVVIMSIFSSIFGMNAQQQDEIKVLDVNEFRTAVDSNNLRLIDVRTLREYNAGHIKNAVNIDVFNRNEFMNFFKKLDTNKPVYIYCRSGSRSKRASKLLVELGFDKIYDLKGGYLNWIRK